MYPKIAIGWTSYAIAAVHGGPASPRKTKSAKYGRDETFKKRKSGARNSGGHSMLYEVCKILKMGGAGGGRSSSLQSWRTFFAPFFALFSRQ